MSDSTFGSPPIPAGVRVEGTNVAGGLASHLAIVVRDEHGNETGHRGGPSHGGSVFSSGGQVDPSTGTTDYGFGVIVTTRGAYQAGFIDYDPAAPKVSIDLNGQSIDTVMKSFDDSIAAIDKKKTPYYPTGPNSNSVVGTMLSHAGLQKMKPTWIAPGFDTDLLK
jgi:hypothetical protein